MRRRLIIIAVLSVIGVLAAAVVAAESWPLNWPTFSHWLAVHTGTVNEPGPYYGFWSGFGSDIGEFGILGAVGTGVYQLVRRHNCHEPGCLRVGRHPAAGGQFLLCYRHHPDYDGSRPSGEMIRRLHREHQEREAAVQDKLHRARSQDADPARTVEGSHGCRA